MGATYVILKFLVMLKSKKKKAGKINFKNISYLTQYIQDVIILT